MKNGPMGKMVKFASQIEAETLKQLKAHVEDADRSISSVLNQAVKEYLERSHIRPAFVEATERVMKRHGELLRRLAK